MAYSDDLALQRARIAANAPYLTQASSSVLSQLIQGFLTPDAYTNINIANAAPNSTWTTAVGAALVAKAADFGVSLSPGIAAGDQVIVWQQALSTAAQVLTAGTLVGTAGVGTTTPAVYFSLPTVTIPANQYVANVTIGTVTSGVGTSLSSSNVTAAASTTQPTFGQLGTYTLTATSSSAYTLSYTPAGGTISTVATGLAVGTTYDSPTYIDGVALTVSGTLTSTNTCTIAVVAAPITVTCQQAGVIGNVTAGTITQTNLGQQSGIQVSNAVLVTTPAGAVSNPYGGNHTGTSINALGVDPDDPVNNPQAIRNKIALVATPQGGPVGAASAVLAIPGVYDILITDPKQATGYAYYWWSSQDGTAAGISGGTTTSSGAPDSTYYLSGPTLMGLALTVDTTLRAYLGGLIPRVGSYSGNSSQVPFVISNVTSLAISYTPATGVQFATIEPLMTAAIQAYINGGTVNGITFPGVPHNKAPTAIGMFQACQQVTGNQLLNFVLTSGGSPIAAVGAAALTTLYRSTGTLTVSYTHI